MPQRIAQGDGGPIAPSYIGKDTTKEDTEAKSVDFKYAEKMGAGLRKQSGQKRTNKRKVKAPERKRAAIKR
jgi:hypothetical protein